MSILRQRQPVLKPQDLLVALKIAVNGNRPFTFAELGHELSMSTSEVHAATKRCELSRLLVRESSQFMAVRLSLQEFILHGVKYVFPGLQGGIVQGMVTGIAAPPLNKYFPRTELVTSVWPDPQGTARGVCLQPLYQSVPAAARADIRLYEVLALIDSLRTGTARERELATSELVSRLS